MSDDQSAGLPLVDPDAVEAPDGGGDRIAGVLLAAGTSSRFGDRNKLLAPLDGEPLVRHAGRTLTAAGLDPRIAVLGSGADAVRDALSGLGFEFVDNPQFEEGQATSVRAAVATLDGVGAAVFALGDMPCVDPASVEVLVTAYRADRGSALAAACDGRRGNPVLFDSRHFDALADVSGDVGGRQILLDGEDSALVETGDPGVLRDVDTIDDYEEIRRDRRV